METFIKVEIDRCIQEQNRCLSDWCRTGDRGALLGLNDFFAEEAIIRKYERNKEV